MGGHFTRKKKTLETAGGDPGTTTGRRDVAAAAPGRAGGANGRRRQRRRRPQPPRRRPGTAPGQRDVRCRRRCSPAPVTQKGAIDFSTINLGEECSGTILVDGLVRVDSEDQNESGTRRGRAGDRRVRHRTLQPRRHLHRRIQKVPVPLLAQL